MFNFWINSLFFCLIVDFSWQNAEFNNLLYHKTGNISIIGIFNDRIGPECKSEIGKGFEEIASVIWTVEALNTYQYIPGISVGLSVFGVCETSNSSNVQLEEFLNFYEDDNIIGILTTADTHKKLSTSGQLSNINSFHIEHIITIDMLTDATIQLLINLRWMNVSSLISDSANILKSFREKATEEGIFTQDELLITTSGDVQLRSFSKDKAPAVVVVIAAFANIPKPTEKMQDENIKLILTPTDFVFDVSLLDTPEMIVSLPAMENKERLSRYIKTGGEFFGKPPTKGPLFVETAASVLKMLKPVKEKLENHCENSCAGEGLSGNKTSLLSQKSMKISPDDLEETLKVLKIDPSPNDEMFLYITSKITGNVLIMISEDVLNAGDPESYKFVQEDAQPRGPVINLSQNLTSPESFKSKQFENVTSPPPEKGCEKQSHMCQDFPINHTAAAQTNETTAVAWRFLTWVSINTSLGFVGITCTLSTMLFTIIKLCKDDILEGSPCFTLLLMVSVILTYVSSLPFHLELSPEFFCIYRKNGPPVIFAGLFSLLLSRSVVRAFGENGREFESHINGYLQSILCFFMIGVQVSIISENWIFEKENYDSSCDDVYDKYKIIFTLGYDFLLLILLACVSPFIIRSKENYKEGLLFSISVFFITVVWSTWISFYVLLPNEHKDAAMAIGLNATASVLLFCIFIPQTYLMAGRLTRDPLRSLSSLDRNILAGVSNFKSSQALNENAFGTITYKNETGLSNPNFLTNRSNGSSNPIRIDPGETVDVSPETSQPI